MGEDIYTYELKELGKKIRFYRERMELTQVELHVKSGIDNADISRIERGQKNVELYTIIKLAEALEVELIDLFKRDKKGT